ncbi:MAG: SprT-like domain-containing protein [Clostridia bacterium]|nr:SprT-like domain-containing protein [Clostridia bacterium]
MQQANDFDKLLALVIRQAQTVHIPIAAQIDAHVAVNTRAKKRFGQCIFYQGRYTIELSSMMLYAPEKSCCQTLAHELIHTCPGCQNHGPLFQQYAAVMNRQYGYQIQRTNTPEELGLSTPLSTAKYLLQCRQCGRKFARERLSAAVRHPDNYHCPCGGRLQRIR